MLTSVHSGGWPVDTEECYLFIRLEDLGLRLQCIVHSCGKIFVFLCVKFRRYPLYYYGDASEHFPGWGFCFESLGKLENR